MNNKEQNLCRLQKYLSLCGVASRRKSEEIIAKGRVRVNDKIIREMGLKVDMDKDTVYVDGKKITPPTKFTYYAVNKPFNYVSTVKDEHAEKKVIDLVPAKPRVYPVGRLDKNSAGLMILTDDGELMQKMTHPGFSHEKEYYVEVSLTEKMNEDEIKKRLGSFEKGIELEDGFTRPCPVRIKEITDDRTRFYIILKEGKKRQIRRMCEAVGLKVRRLIRIRMGKLKITGMKPGEYRKIAKRDIL